MYCGVAIPSLIGPSSQPAERIPEKLLPRNNHLKYHATEKLGGLGRHICTHSRTSQRNHRFRLASGKCPPWVFVKVFIALLERAIVRPPFREESRNDRDYADD